VTDAALTATDRKAYLKGLWQLNRYLVPYWPLQALVLLIILLISMVGLVNPMLVRVMIDYAFGTRDLHVFHVLLGVGALVYLLLGSLGVVQQYLSAYIGNMLTFDIRREYTRHFFRLSFSDLYRRSTGEHIYRIGPDIDSVSTLATDSIPGLVTALFRLAFLVVICSCLSWRLTVATLLVAPLFYVQARYFGVRQKRLTRGIKEKAQETMAELQDAISNVKLVKAFGKEPWAVRRYLRNRVEIIRLVLTHTRVLITGNLTAGFLATSTMTAFTYYVGLNVIRGRVSLGTLVALMIYLGQLFGSIRALGRLYRSVLTRFVSWERVQETLGLNVPEEGAAARSVRAVQGRICCERVRFGYAPDRPVLDEVSFELEPGAFMGLVGPSGSGKTTLLLLLLRLMRPWEGRILLDGLDLNAIRWRSLQPFLGVALQEGLVTNGTIEANLRFGAPDASEVRLWEALACADLAETVRSMERGLQTNVGEKGGSLSEGQRQRLSIARALVGRPRVLLLDEATSSVGFDSERRIVQNLRADLPDSTLIVASHRLSALRNAGRILVLEDGRVSEQGTHADLVHSGGLYSRIFEEQIRGSEAGS